jgi:hypothetical protein
MLTTQPKLRTRERNAPILLHRQIWTVIHDAISQHIGVPFITRGDRSRKAVTARIMFVAYLKSIGYSGYRIAKDLEVERCYITDWKRMHADRVVYDPEYRREWQSVKAATDTAVKAWEEHRENVARG